MIFLSYSRADQFEAELLQFAFEALLGELGVRVWTYQRDQSKSQSHVATALKERVRESKAMCFLVSDSTLSSGAAQWMELAYADAFDVPTFILLHRVAYTALRSFDGGVPPLLRAAQCNDSIQWRAVAGQLREELSK